MIFCTVASVVRLAAQQPPPKPEPDVLIFVDDEKLVGHLVKSDGATVTFKSDIAGDITVEWKKVKELRAAGKYAVIPKGAELKKAEVATKLPQGQVASADQKVNVQTSAGLQTIPVGDVGHIVEEPAFEKALESPGFFGGWKGAVTGGASLVEATQNSRSFSGAVALVRAIPQVDWLTPRNRTLLDYTQAYGTVSEPGTPTIKTSIFHADAERDEFVSNRIFLFGQAALDHNFSQGLDLQQTYGGGIGFTLLKEANQELDLKGGVAYIRQAFSDSSNNKNLFGSTFGETYTRTLPRGMVLIQTLTLIPAWNDLSAYSGIAGVNLTAPVYKRLNFTIAAIDNFLNNPPAGFKKNSFQFTLGLTYTLP